MNIRRLPFTFCLLTLLITPRTTLGFSPQTGLNAYYVWTSLLAFLASYELSDAYDQLTEIERIQEEEETENVIQESNLRIMRSNFNSYMFASALSISCTIWHLSHMDPNLWTTVLKVITCGNLIGFSALAGYRLFGKVTQKKKQRRNLQEIYAQSKE